MAAQTFTITGTTPNSPSTAVVGSVQTLDRDVDTIDVIATLAGATGGVLDLYLQTSEDQTTWTDIAHFAQLTAAQAASVKRVILNHGQSASAPVAVGQNTTPALAANTVVPGFAGKYVRLLAVAGASTTLGAAQTVVLNVRYKVTWAPNY